MFRSIKYYTIATLKAFKHRKILISQLDRILKNLSNQRRVEKFIGYYPEALECTDLSILKLSPSSKIGRENRLIINRPKYPCSENESIISLGKNCWTGSNVEINILTGTQIIIKDFTTVQDFCKIIGDVIIEKYCLLAPSVFISSGNHYAERDNPDIIRNQDEYHLTNQDLIGRHSRKVHIEEDCWVGFSAFIRAGIYIGRGSVIGSNAIVTKDVLPYSIIGGIQNLIGQRFAFTPPVRIEASVKDHKPYFYRGFLHKNGEHHLMNNDQIILGHEVGVVILKKGSLKSFRASGRVINCKSDDKLVLSILHNGGMIFSTQLNIDTQGAFQLEIYADQFQTSSLFGEDQVLQLASTFNVFHITCPLLSPWNHEELKFIAFDYFDEELSE